MSLPLVVDGVETDPVLEQIARYVISPPPFSQLARDTALDCLMDSIGCIAAGLADSNCASFLRSLVQRKGRNRNHSVHVPLFGFREAALDGEDAAFFYGSAVRWLDFNDTWLAQEWGHPSDNLGGILPTAYVMSASHKVDYYVSDIIDAMIMAHEIQGQLAIDTCLNAVGIDHVLLVKVASAAVITSLMRGRVEDVVAVVSQAFQEPTLRDYRHDPQAGPRKSWAAGDATSRAYRWAAARMATGDPGYPKVLSDPKWGFNANFMNRERGTKGPIDPGNRQIRLRDLGHYVMENVLFKVQYPAEFHSQTAVEAAVQLHPQVKDRIGQIAKVLIWTQEPGVRIISKKGPLLNPAARDHCIEYMTLVGLLTGRLTEHHYENEWAAAHPELETLRQATEVVEEPRFTKEYYDLDKRYIGNAVQVVFNDGSKTEKVSIDYPLGHRERRQEAAGPLREKFNANLAKLGTQATDAIALLFDPARRNQLLEMPITKFVESLSFAAP